MAVDDVAIIIVTHDSALWILPCLQSVFAHLGGLRADVVVADTESNDRTAELVNAEFPQARVIRCQNRGFAYANNQALITCNARYVLFLNPDTEIWEGTIGDLVRAMESREDVGLVGVRQVNPEGRLDRTIRYFPNAVRAFGDALSAEHLPGRPRWLGERELDPGAYDREIECDWTSGSFMLVRREAIEAAGFLDERFFMYSEETDFCRRISSAGWAIRHLPTMTIMHHGADPRVTPDIESLSAYNRIVYARKHFSWAHRALYIAAVLLRNGIRSVYAGRGEEGRLRREANRAAVSTLLGRSQVPHGPPSSVSVQPEQPPDSVGVS